MTRKQKKHMIRKVKERAKRIFTGSFAMYFFLTSLFAFWTPNTAHALTGGPSQPEVQSFEPIGTSDMVNLFSGDFTYNIPLLDVEGYPINIAYNSGVTMDQEASWTGLGWNINVGTINRALRGLPDDFKGDEVRTEMNMKPNTTFGIQASSDEEVFGGQVPDNVSSTDSTFNGLSLNVSIGVNYNNYNGIGFDFGFSPGLNFVKNGIGPSGSLGLNSNSSSGLSVNPSASFSTMQQAADGKISKGLTSSVGASFNSRQGLSSLSIGLNPTINSQSSRKLSTKNRGFSSSMGGAANFDLMQPTYTPSISQSMTSFAISARFKGGTDVYGGDFGFALDNISYSTQRLKKSDRDKKVKSYGYLYSEVGQTDKNARHDFNRENQGSVTPATPNLALTNYTYDVYSVSGQGVGGSYRPYRGQIGYVYDNTATNKSTSVPITLEISAGALFHGGTSIGLVTVKSQSGAWTEKMKGFKGDNKADETFNFANKGSGKGFENFAFREANEMSVATDPLYYDIFQGDEPIKPDLKVNSKWNVEATGKINTTDDDVAHTIPRNHTEGRVKRNNTIQHLTVKQVRNGTGIVDFIPNTYAADSAEDHHIGQIISLGTDGMRYVYGQPAYNTLQQEVTFAVGQTVGGQSFTGLREYDKGLITYNPFASGGDGPDNSINNKWGLDNYFQRVSMPAFAHSYLLSAVVSDDYVDVDGIKGPSDGDLGSYTKFSYQEVGGVNRYKWRVPVQANKASYNEGLKGDFNDDKGSYLYGEKELFYLREIETKNFIAVFKLGNRKDAFGVVGQNGGILTTMPMKFVEKISLYSKEDIRNHNGDITLATPLKEVHFDYTYDLCQGIPNSNIGEGKLTLTKIYFTYRDSKKGKLSPYEFKYQNNNYGYDLKEYDRWGSYKPNTVTTGAFGESGIATFEFPYVDQNQATANDYTSAWTLSQIDLPSGGVIIPEFESDDYAFVQNKQAMIMHKIVTIGELGNGGYVPKASPGLVESLSDAQIKNKRIYFEKDPLISTQAYVQGIEDLYFKCMMEFDDSVRYDYVPGYAKIAKIGEDPNNASLGYIDFEPVSFSDGGSEEINPIVLAGIQFGRLYLSKYVWDSPAFNENQTLGGQVINALWQTLANFVEEFKNPNKTIYDKDRGTKIVINKSWIRLNDVHYKKLGGGCRVARITINDNWTEMVPNAQNVADADYGQIYDYTLEQKVNGVNISSGVASYEPQLGGEENPWKTPIKFQDKKRWAPDDRFFQETPLGESFFPSPSVGYSKVTVRNLQYASVKRNATGRVVHEFYTARDFPTITKKTDIEPIQKKTNPFDLGSLLKLVSKDYYTGSQGFVVITNDMHGKPKSQKVYQEDQDNPITKVEYEYQSIQGAEVNTKEITNQVNLIHKSGVVSLGMIGVNFDVVADFQESRTKVYNANVGLNIDLIPLAFLPFPVPTVWPKFSTDKTLFRSAVLTKVVQKFGVLKNTKATDLGSVVETRNLAYDAETGQVLLTETVTDFNDKIYTMNFPAYWHYDNMGSAYRNISYKEESVAINAGQFILSPGHLFVVGDELSILKSNGNTEKVWLTDILGSIATVQLKNGSAPANDTYDVLVIRSGRRNMQSQMMASITTRKNPINSFQSNIYEDVIQASAIEFTDKWRTYCDCSGDVSTASTNPYFLGTRGNYKPKVSYLHLADRTQSDKNNNTNIRDDGMFKSYTPYYQIGNYGNWVKQSKDWTYTAEVTEFNPFGQELENQDALGRYSSAEFGFNQTLAKAVAANSRYREIGFTSFEDDNFSTCADNHFKFDNKGAGIVNTTSHTGEYSVKVTPTASASIKKDLTWCDQSGCTLGLSIAPNSSGFIAVEVTNGSSNSVVSYNIISGTPSIIPTETGPQILMQGTFDVEFIVVDENGCQDIQLITVVNGQIQN